MSAPNKKAARLMTVAARITTLTANYTTTRLWLAGYLLEECREACATDGRRFRQAACTAALALLRTVEAL
jgi:hypothetical protein